MIPRVFILLAVLWMALPGQALEHLTLQSCRDRARANYPVVRQYHLLDLTEQYDLENVVSANRPQITLNGKASYQSSVTTLPVSLPGISIKGLPKDEYQVLAEVRQNVWDGGRIKIQKERIKADAAEQRRQTDVDLYKLNERVDQLYFNILLQEELLMQNALLQEELARNYSQVSSYIKNGVASESDLDAVRMEQLNARQQQIGYEADRKASLKMLGLLTGEELPENTTLLKPDLPGNNGEINRPELKWYDARLHLLDVGEQALKAAVRPSFSLFVQGGTGNPGLNMLKNGWEMFYVIGARITWNFSNFYTLKNDRLKLDAQRQAVIYNRDAFLLNTRIQITEQEEGAETIRRQMQEDDEIIRLHANVRKAAEAKVAGGTLSVTEMLRELTGENMARQNKAVHEIQLLMRLYRKQNLTN